MATRLKVLVLTTKLPEDIWLINRVAEECDIVGVVLPTGRRYRDYGAWRVLKKRLPRVGVWKVANQALLVAYRWFSERARDRAAETELLVGRSFTRIEASGLDVREVDEINSPEICRFILSRAPDVVVVSGAPLLSSPILQAAHGNIVNLHPGFAPEYRGRYGSFWPIYNREPQMVGTTIHFVDRGIDTGKILAQRLVGFRPNDSLRAITLRQHVVGVDLLVQCLQHFEESASAAYRKSGCPDRNYLAPGLTHYVRARRWLRRTT